VKRFRSGLVVKAHRLWYHSTLGLKIMKKQKKERGGYRDCRGLDDALHSRLELFHLTLGPRGPPAYFKQCRRPDYPVFRTLPFKRVERGGNRDCQGLDDALHPCLELFHLPAERERSLLTTYWSEST